MFDLHSHVLPGLDDGAATIEESLEILAAARAEGVTHLAATPHVRDDYPTTPEAMEDAVAELRALGSGVEVLPGGELDLAYLERLDDAALRRFGLGGNRALLLLEFPYAGWPLQLRDLVFRLGVRGFSVVLAHPERNAEVQEQPELLRELVGAGVAVQLTGWSVEGRFGRRVATTARTLLELGLAHVIASDVHGASVRSSGIRGAVEALGDDRLATWLTREVPEALLASRPLPPRPATRRPRTMRLPWHR